MHAQSFAKDGKNGNAQAQVTTAQNNTAVPAPVAQVPQPTQDNSMISTFDPNAMDGLQDVSYQEYIITVNILKVFSSAITCRSVLWTLLMSSNNLILMHSWRVETVLIS